MEEGEDKYKLLKSLQEAAKLYLETIVKEKCSEDQLNYEMDQEYESLWQKSQTKKQSFLSTDEESWLYKYMSL